MGKFDDLVNRLYINPAVQMENMSGCWDQIILGQVENLKNQRENFCVANQQQDPDTIKNFGTAQPGADHYLLHCAPGWKSNSNKIPVLLIPGAGLDANSFVKLYNMPYEGLQPQLTSLGYRVFALTFSHSHGDNFYQAEQLAHAIAQVKSLCQAPQVDLIAYSKGGLAARIYLSNLGATCYRGDVRRYVMLGTPNLGVDFAFRNPALALPIFLSSSNGVIPWDQVNYLGASINTSAQAIYRDGCFPGQNQMLYRWDQEYALDLTQVDWWTTYYGGQGFISHSRGIDAAISDGDNLITRLEQAGIAADVELAVLAGNNHMFGLSPGDNSGPGDGIVFLDSAFNTGGMLSQGAKLLSKTQLTLNHLELLFAYSAVGWVDQQLRIC